MSLRVANTTLLTLLLTLSFGKCRVFFLNPKALHLNGVEYISCRLVTSLLKAINIFVEITLGIP